MTDNEIDQAIKALKSWFQSQDISPADAGLMMIKLMAELYTHKTRNILELGEAVRDTNMLLSIEIAGYLRK